MKATPPATTHVNDKSATCRRINHCSRSAMGANNECLADHAVRNLGSMFGAPRPRYTRNRLVSSQECRTACNMQIPHPTKPAQPPNHLVRTSDPPHFVTRNFAPNVRHEFSDPVLPAGLWNLVGPGSEIADARHRDPTGVRAGLERFPGDGDKAAGRTVRMPSTSDFLLMAAFLFCCGDPALHLRCICVASALHNRT